MRISPPTLFLIYFRRKSYEAHARICLMFQVHDEHDGFKANAQHALQ
jgi:hypothetical protein